MSGKVCVCGHAQRSHAGVCMIEGCFCPSFRRIEDVF